MQTRRRRAANSPYTRNEVARRVSVFIWILPSEKYLVPSTAHLGARHQNTTALCHSFVVAWHWHREGTKLWHRDTTSHFHLLGTKPSQHIWHCNGTKRPQYWHCNGTGTPPPPWHLAGTKLPPIWHLPGTCLALSGHLAGTKKYLLLSGTFLAPYWHQFCSTIWIIRVRLAAAIEDIPWQVKCSWSQHYRLG